MAAANRTGTALSGRSAGPDSGGCAVALDSGRDLSHRRGRLLLWPQFPAAVLLRRLFGGLNARYAEEGAYIYGFLGGVSTVLAHAGGLVWSLYLITAARDRRIFVGTTIILFFVTNIYKTVSYVYIGIIGPDDLLKVIPAIPMIFLGSYLGNVINKRCNYILFRKIVLCFILFISVSLCI